MRTKDNKRKAVYLSVVGFPDYEVGDDGSIWSKKAYNRPTLAKDGPRLLRPRKNCYGYLQVSLRVGKKTYTRTVHRLVLEAFDRPRPKGMQCSHYDGDRANNRLENLRWDTSKGNHADRIRHGRSGKGQTNSQAKLTEPQVREVRQRLANGERAADVARYFNVAKQTVSDIKIGRKWSWL
jgi:hypothetical protein